MNGNKKARKYRNYLFSAEKAQKTNKRSVKGQTELMPSFSLLKMVLLHKAQLRSQDSELFLLSCSAVDYMLLMDLTRHP